MQLRRRRPGRARLLSGQSEIANKLRFRRIAEIIDLRHAPNAPVRLSRDKECNAGIAFPPTLMRIAKSTDDNVDAAWLDRVGDVPDFVCRSTVSAQQIRFAFIRSRQLTAVAYANHLRSA